jgi:trehalose 6-phosphate synthase/phosphatase
MNTGCSVQVTLLQISVPSRTDVKEYQELKEEMDQLVGRINGRFTTPNWSPIKYIYGCVSQDELAAFYRDAAVALVTPLRDGACVIS